MANVTAASTAAGMPASMNAIPFGMNHWIGVSTAPGNTHQPSSDIARAGSMVGYVGVPHGVELPVGELFYRNKGVRGGPAPARAYIPELLDDVLAGRIDPGRVLDYKTDLDGIADAYAAMDERRAIKSLVRVGTM